MFEAIFEVHPIAAKFDAYLNIAKSLKPILESTRGFIENVRYKSMMREGWLLSVSDWEDEKSLVRWRTNMKHHGAQEKGRNMVFVDYRIRIGEVYDDSKDAAMNGQKQMRFDETEAGDAKVITMMNASIEGVQKAGEKSTEEVLKAFGFDPSGSHGGLVAYDVYEAILTTGDYLLFCTWKDPETAEAACSKFAAKAVDRTRHVRVIRDYTMFNRDEAPQYYPEVAKPT